MRIGADVAARVTNGRLIVPAGGAAPESDGIWYDTRTLPAGRAFVAVTGDRDGHDHLATAAAAGAPWALVARGRAHPSLACVEVDDTLAALAALAAHCRDRLEDSCGTRVVGITGSAGKTTTKDLIGAVLVAGFPGARASAGSLNNDLGMPVTITNAPEDCPALVLEMGMRGFGEIERLCRIARPSIGVVTIVGDAHSDRVGGIDGVARAKGEMVRALDANGTAVLNADDPRVAAMAADCAGDVVTYGRGAADVRWRIVDRDQFGRAEVEFVHAGNSAVGRVPWPGDHMAANAAAAVAVGVVTGLSLDACASALAAATTAPGRVQWRTAGDVHVLDDTYNANSSSMLAALDTIAAAQVSGARVAVLGAMAEIDDPVAAHRAVAAHAASLGVSLVALETDLYGTVAHDVDSAVAIVRSMGGVVVLVKGSRSSRTERVVAALGAV